MSVRKRVVYGAGLALLMLWVTGIVSAETVAPTLLAPPDGFEAIGPGPNVLRLTWEPVEETVGYEVRISQPTSEFDDFVRFTRWHAIPFGGGRTGEYEWQVRCVYADPDIESASRPERIFGPWSENWSFSIVRAATDDITPGVPEGAPTVLFPKQGDVLIAGNEYRFEWSPVEGAPQYQVLLETPRGPLARIVPGTFWMFRGAAWAGGFSDRGFLPEGAYGFSVRAISRQGRGHWSEKVQFEYKYEGDHTDCWNWEISSATPPMLIAPADKAILNPLEEGLIGIFSWTRVANARHYEILFQKVGGQHLREPLQDGTEPFRPPREMYDPPTSALVRDVTYALVIPDATAGAEYVWRVRAIVDEGVEETEKLLPTRWSFPRSFVIGPVVRPEEEGEPIVLLSPDDGAIFAGPEAAISFSWMQKDRERLCQVTITDATGNLVMRQYRNQRWDAEIVGLGEYRWQVRGVVIGRDGRVLRLGPASEQRRFQIKEDTIVDGAQQLGDLVFDNSVDSGDAIRALRHSTDPENNPLRIREMLLGDCNGDGRVDSGDAIYMLRKAVGSTR